MAGGLLGGNLPLVTSLLIHPIWGKFLMTYHRRVFAFGAHPTRSVLLFWQHLQQMRIQQGQHTNQQQTNQKTKRTMDNLSWNFESCCAQWMSVAVVKVSTSLSTWNHPKIRKILVVTGYWAGGRPQLNSKRFQNRKTKDTGRPHKKVDII